MPVGGGGDAAAAATAAAAPPAGTTATVTAGGGADAAGSRGRATQRFSVALFSARTSSLVSAPRLLTYRFSPFSPATGVEPIAAAYAPSTRAYYLVARNVAVANAALPPADYSLNSGVSYTLASLDAAAPAGGGVGGGGDPLPTRLLTVSFPDPATRAGAAELSPAASAFLDVASSASTLQLGVAVTTSVGGPVLTAVRYDFGLSASSRATLSGAAWRGRAAVFGGGAAPSARLPTMLYGSAAAAAASAADATRAGGGGAARGPSPPRWTPAPGAARGGGAPPPSTARPCDAVRASAAGTANATAVLWPPLGAAASSGAGAPAARWEVTFGTRYCAEAVAGAALSAGGTVAYLVGATASPTPTAAAARPARTAGPVAVPSPVAGGGGEEDGVVTAEGERPGGEAAPSGGDDGGVLWGLGLPVVVAIGAGALVAVCVVVAAVAYLVRTSRT
ncbi:hypothetical protein BU14_0329s0009 [Porphyra umbilicalis]|uniref:Uncharacterized protein n=1 Tax=Porphyra umbilicalis TaxID=2786 RepID=A0A1X6NYP3_PORUM|nr:hypothetical protein BU14_0329s0009 [Porphyra umbilicalis]|eukprot:OSX73741.1 hypothetical protein BU14_0329s0009 [Porphyra umbilicalis]